MATGTSLSGSASTSAWRRFRSGDIPNDNATPSGG
jgi:hypothetical protein